MTLRKKVFTIIFGTSTKAGKTFDIALLIFILLSVTIVIFESVNPWRMQNPRFFSYSEWFFTIIFSIEYILRIYSHPKPLKYITSFLGIIDLLAILPAFLGLVVNQANFLLTIRAFRLIRVFRILKLTRYITEADQLAAALKSSMHKIIVFFEVILVFVLFMGTIMYMVEGEESGFNSIPQSIYWAIVTITTVGYGDIAPITIAGKLIASLAMLTGYSIIAVPTGIITAEIGKFSGKERKYIWTKCDHCSHISKDKDAKYCSHCGKKLNRT